METVSESQLSEQEQQMSEKMGSEAHDVFKQQDMEQESQNKTSEEPVLDEEQNNEPPQNSPLSTPNPHTSNHSSTLNSNGSNQVLTSAHLTISIKNLASFKTLNPLKQKLRESQATLEHGHLSPRTSHTLNRLGFQPDDLLKLSREQKKDFIIERRAVDLMMGRPKQDNGQPEASSFTSASLMHADGDAHDDNLAHHPAQKALRSFHELKNKKIKQLLNWIQSEHERLQWIQQSLDSWENKSQGSVSLAEQNAAAAAHHNQKWKESTEKQRDELRKQQQEILERLEKHQQALQEANKRRQHRLKEKSTFVKSKREFSEKVLRERQKQIRQQKEQKRKEKEQNEYIRQLNVQNTLQDEKEKRGALLRRHMDTIERNLEKHEKIQEEREIYALVKKHQYDTKLDQLEHQKLLEQRRTDQIRMEKERKRQEAKQKAEEILAELQESALKKYDEFEDKRQQTRLKREKRMEVDREKMVLAEEKRQENIARAERIFQFKRSTYEQKVDDLAKKMEQWEQLKSDTLSDVHYNQEFVDQKVEEITNVVQDMVSKGDWDLDRLRILMNDLKTTRKATTMRRTRVISASDPNPLTETAVPRYMQWVSKQQEEKKEKQAALKRMRSKTPTYGVRRLSHHPSSMDPLLGGMAAPPPRKSKTPTISRRPASAHSVGSLRKSRDVQQPQEKIPRANQSSVQLSRKRPSLVSSSATIVRGSLKGRTSSSGAAQQQPRKFLRPRTPSSTTTSGSGSSSVTIRPKSASAVRRPSSASTSASRARRAPGRDTNLGGVAKKSITPHQRRPQSAGRTQRSGVRASQNLPNQRDDPIPTLRGGRASKTETATTIVDSAVKQQNSNLPNDMDDDEPSSLMKPRVVIRHLTLDEASKIVGTVHKEREE